MTQYTISWCRQLQGFAVDQWRQKNSSKKFGPLFVSFRCNQTNIGFNETKKTRNEEDSNFFSGKKSAFEVFLFFVFFCKKDKNEIENKTKQGPISKKGPEIYLNKLNNCVCSFKAGRDLKQQLVHFLCVLGFKKSQL